MITPTRTPVKTTPDIFPKTDPDKHFDPEPDYCPNQWVRTVRKIGPLLP